MKNNLKQEFARNLKFAETNAVLSLSLNRKIFSTIALLCGLVSYTLFLSYRFSLHAFIARALRTHSISKSY